MVEIVPLNEYGLQTAQYRIVIGAFDDGRVQGDKWSFRSERPQMNVMDVNHTRNRLRQVLPQEADVQASGCSFHQHVPGFLDQVQALRTMRKATKTDRIGSMGVQPVSRMTIAATIAAAEPSRSPRTCKAAPRMFRFSRSP